MKRICLLLGLIFIGIQSFCQGFNNNSQKSYISITMPKTPESQSFEKYGNIPVEEFSGTTSISVPLYNVKGKFLEAPVSLAYHSSGIKVNQEATWVGLGFDLIAGGRITVETKGNVDDNVKNLTGQPFFKTGIKRLFNKWKIPYAISPNAPQLGYAFLDYAKFYGSNYTPDDHINDTLWDDNFTVTNAAWYGAGEPDIYHANFLGNSVNFYIDVNDGLKFIGEKSTFYVGVNRDANDNISDFTITDNSGVRYLFEQKEKTKVSVLPNYAFASSVESNSAWLLTKVIHPSLDTLKFTYTNFGKTYPAFTWTASYSTSLPFSGVTPSNELPNQVEQDPYYLSKIESANTTLDFIMSAREDLRGAGAKKLDRIDIKDKVTSTLIKQVVFTYDYFTSNLEPYENAQPDSVKIPYSKRLRLLSVLDNNSTENKPWVFNYKNQTGPSKLSFSQDHWGYYNGAPNSSFGTNPPTASPLRLIPTFTSLGNLETRTIGATIYSYTQNSGSCNETILDGQSSSETIPLGLDGNGDRNCSPANIQAYMMDSVTYPTGGSTKFEYEPHRSNYANKNISDFVGGGLRIKSVKNYSDAGKIENTTEYDYMNSGIYLGAIEYIRIATRWPSGQSITMSSSGDMNNDKQYVGYASIKKIIKDNNNLANNGYTIKYYQVYHPLQITYSNTQHPFSPYIRGGLDCGNMDKSFLLKRWSANAPTPQGDLDGKMYLEEIYDNLGNKIKYTNYYYRQAQQTNDFYSLKVADNYVGYPGVLGFIQPGGCSLDKGKGFDGGCYIRWNRWEVCVTPAVSYFTVIDSIVDKTLGPNGNYITQKTANTYNSYNQVEFSTTYNSDGTQLINYIKTPLSYIRQAVPGAGQGDALLIDQMRQSHIYDLPIEQITLKRNQNGDSLVLGSRYNVYEYAAPKKVYTIEITTPLAFRTQFVPSYYYNNYPAVSGFFVATDSKYKLQESADYYTSKLVKDIISAKGKKAFIWDDTYSTILAECEDATSDNIAFTSFETATTGNWIYTGISVADPASPTGGKSYNLATGNISKSALDATKTYVISFWYKTGATVIITGGTQISSVVGRSFGNWTYQEYRITGTTTITISGTGSIDELRLYPDKTFMKSYTYKPLTGIRSVCDANNRISYYEYDALNRLSLIKDQDNKIIKKICYNYAGQVENCIAYGNVLRNGFFTRNNCASGLTGSTVEYIVPASTYFSSISQDDANAQAQAAVTANGQAYANANGTCTSACSFAMNSGYTLVTSTIGNNGATASFFIAFYPSATMQLNSTYTIATINGNCRPSAIRTLTTTTVGGRTWMITIIPSGQMSFKLTSGPPLPANNAVSTSTLTYNL